MSGTPSTAVAFPVTESVDWRIVRLAWLTGEDWLAGEWNPDSQLILPQPGGRLHGLRRCVVPGCPSDGHWSHTLCVRHRDQVEASGHDHLEAWLASGEPKAFLRRRGTDQACAVTAADGRICPRPAEGRWRLCPSHILKWWKRRRKGDSFEEFLSRAQPLADLGECAAACCYRAAAYPQTRLCLAHAQIWRADGRLGDEAFTEWAALVRQPVNSRVLSLRGLPELVRLELVYAIGCRAAEQVTVVTGGMRPWIDQLRALGVGSVAEFDLGRLEGIGDRHHVRFARFSVDVVNLAYADPEFERTKDVWDLRLFGRPGRKRLDFRAIRQPWLREVAKGWAAATIGRVGDSAMAHRVGSLAVFSAVLASGPGGGEDPPSLARADIERFLARVRSPHFPDRSKAWGPRPRRRWSRIAASCLGRQGSWGCWTESGPASPSAAEIGLPGQPRSRPAGRCRLASWPS